MAINFGDLRSFPSKVRIAWHFEICSDNSCLNTFNYVSTVDNRLSSIVSFSDNYYRVCAKSSQNLTKTLRTKGLPCQTLVLLILLGRKLGTLMVFQVMTPLAQNNTEIIWLIICTTIGLIWIFLLARVRVLLLLMFIGIFGDSTPFHFSLVPDIKDRFVLSICMGPHLYKVSTNKNLSM